MLQICVAESTVVEPSNGCFDVRLIILFARDIIDFIDTRLIVFSGAVTKFNEFLGTDCLGRAPNSMDYVISFGRCGLAILLMNLIIVCSLSACSFMMISSQLEFWFAETEELRQGLGYWK